MVDVKNDIILYDILHTKNYGNYKGPVPYMKYLKIYDIKLIGLDHICWITQSEVERKEYQPSNQNPWNMVLALIYQQCHFKQIQLVNCSLGWVGFHCGC